MPPVVSLVMPVYDPDPGFLRQALTGVLAQSMDDWELIVIEEPGPRSASQVLGEFDDPRIRHFKNAERRSLAALRDQGLQLATADLVAMQDSDDVSQPERLARQVEFLREHQDIVLVGARVQLIDHDNKALGYRRYPLSPEAILEALPRFNPIPQPCVMFRRQAVMDAGGYAEREDGICEDYELWSRLARARHRMANLKDVLLQYRVHPAGMKSRKLRGTLRDTIRIKKQYWQGQMNLSARARMWGERALLLLPPRLVMSLFLRRSLHATPE